MAGGGERKHPRFEGWSGRCKECEFQDLEEQEVGEVAGGELSLKPIFQSCLPV